MKQSPKDLLESGKAAISEAAKKENLWDELGGYKFKLSEDARAKRVYSQNKYILYHYTSFDTAKKIIEGSSLRFSSPDDFNDPFDLNFDIFDFESDIEGCVDFFGRMFPVIDKEEFKEQVKQTVSRDPDFIRKNGVQMLKEIKDALGVTCFSEEYDNALMWSHYADKHRGVCIGIKLGSTESYNIMPVNYVEEMPKLNFYKHMNPDLHLIYLWLYYKLHIWAYEKEVRAICPNIHMHCKNAQRLIEFPKEDITEIYIGLKSSENAASEIELLLQNNGYDPTNIKITKMAINPKSYSFI